MGSTGMWDDTKVSLGLNVSHGNMVLMVKADICITPAFCWLT